MNSYIVIKSDELKKICNNTLDYIYKHRQEKLQNFVVQQREKIINGFWHKLLKQPVPTDEEIIQLDKERDLVFRQTHWIKTFALDNEYLAKDLLYACKMSDEIHLSISDLSKLL